MAFSMMPTPDTVPWRRTMDDEEERLGDGKRL